VATSIVETGSWRKAWLEGMRLLVFGRTGQVARELQTRCPEGWKIRALDRQAADLSEPLTCASAIEFTDADVIVNAAAYTAVDRAESESRIATIVNSDAPGAMARATAAAGKPFIHLSTDYVFDGSGSNAWRPEDKTAPLSTYGASKLAGEQEVAQADGQFVILRTSWIFSVHGQNFVKSMLRLSEDRSILRIVSDQIGGPTPASSIADALFTIAHRMKLQPDMRGIYHFAGVPETNWADLAREIYRLADISVSIADIKTNGYPTAARRPLNSRLDCTSLEKDFEIKRPDWRTCLINVLKELKINV
jgi:dTDP-4-dehydrorhamnose reductase